MNKCVFCLIIDGKIKSKILYQNEHIIVLSDIKPQAKYHFLIIPKKHTQTPADTDAILLGEMTKVATKMSDQFNFASSGYRLIINVGSDGGQEVSHLHLHLLGGEKIGPMVCQAQTRGR